MSTICKISLDASEYRNELDKVVSETKTAQSKLGSKSNINHPAISAITKQEYVITGRVSAPEIPQAEDQTYTVTGRVSAPEIPQAEDQTYTVTGKIDTKSVEQSIQQTSGVIRKCSSFFKNIIPQEFGSKISKGAALISAFGTAAGTSVPPVGLLSAAVNALLSPIALVTAAISGLAALGMHVWDLMTVSADEYADKVKTASEEAQRHTEKIKAQDQAAQGYLSRLQEIASAESAGNSSKIETMQILENLQNQYGNLGAVIDETTGKIVNLADVEARANSARNRKLSNAYYRTSEAKMDEVRAAYMKVKGDEWFTSEYGAGEIFDKMRETMSPEDMLKEMEKLAAEATTSTDIQGYTAVADKIREALQSRNKAKKITEHGYETDEEYRAALAKKSQQVGQAKTTNILLDKSAARKKSDNEFAFLHDSDAKIENRQQLIAEERKRQINIQKEINNAQKAVSQADTTEQKLDAQKRLLDAQAQYKRSEASVAEIEQQIAQIKYEQSEAKRKLTEQSAYDLEYNKLILAGQHDKAAALKLEYDLKQQNLKLTQAEKQALLDQQKAQKSLSLQASLRDKAKALQYSAMQAAGQSREADKLKALDEAEKIKGSALTDDEKSMVNKLSELTANLDRISKDSISSASHEIITNSLTARGGWAGGAVVPDKDQTNKSIDAKMSKVSELLDNIKSLQNEIKTVINKGLSV